MPIPKQKTPAGAAVGFAVIQGTSFETVVARFFAIPVGVWDSRSGLAARDLLRSWFAQERVDGGERGSDERDAGLDHAEEGDERVVPWDVGGADPEDEGADADAGGDDGDEGYGD